MNQLSCTICKVGIRSEKMWNTHVKTNLHLENIKKLNETKEKKCHVVTVGKNRKEVPEKRITRNPELIRIQDIEHSNDTNNEVDDVPENQLAERFMDDPKNNAKVLFHFFF